MSDDFAEKEKAGRMMRRATVFAVAVGLILIVAKLTAWLGTGSVALLSTLIDSTLDSIASLVNLLAVHHALSPADAEHRFGHGKAEPLAGLAQSAFIGGSGLLLIGEAAQRLWEPQPVTHGVGGIAVMGLSMVLTLALVTYQKRVIARTKSVAITADRLHYASDLMMNAGVIVSLLLSAHLGWTFIDPLFAMGIAVYILWGAGKLAWGSFNLLMDREFAPEDRTRIKAICEAHPLVRNMHDLRTRSAGQADFIQLHLVLDGEMSLRRAHDISDAVEAEIRAAFPRADIIIHQDPDGLVEPRKDFDEE